MVTACLAFPSACLDVENVQRKSKEAAQRVGGRLTFNPAGAVWSRSKMRKADLHATEIAGKYVTVFGH